MNPEKKRPPEEYKEMDEKNKIKGDALVFTQAPPPPLVPPPSVPIIQNVAPSRRGRGRAAIQQQQIQQSPSIQNNIQNQSNYDGPVINRFISIYIYQRLYYLPKNYQWISMLKKRITYQLYQLLIKNAKVWFK